MVEAAKPTLSRGMRHLNGVYTQSFNRRHARSGHLFQGRFKAILVQKETHLLEVARYVVANPVRARLVRDPGDWEWSSYRATAGLSEAPDPSTVDWILSQLHSDPTRAARAYRTFVDLGRGVALWDGLRGGAILGGDAFIARLKPRLKERAAVTEIPSEQRLIGRPRLEDRFAEARDKAGRDERIYQAVRVHGYTLRQVAEFLGLYYSTISLIAKRVAQTQERQK